MSERALHELKRMGDLSLRKQAQDGLAQIFERLGCHGVAEEIRAGRDITGNVEYGIRHCVHDKVGPRVNVETWEFHQMTANARSLEQRFLENVNKLLKYGGFRTVSPKLLAELRRKDKEFEERIEKRKDK
jgi:hypothetical protein